MKRRLHVNIAIASGLTLALLIAASGVISELRYDGDGEFTAHGWFIGSRRYSVDFGAVNTGQLESREYSVRSLPSEDYTLGFEISGLQPAGCRQLGHPYRAVVAITLVRADGAVVIADTNSLESWTWSPSCESGTGFLWRSSESRWTGSRDNPRVEKLAVRSDSGWGSSFVANSANEYVLTLRVVAPDSQPSHPSIRLVLYGGLRTSF